MKADKEYCDLQSCFFCRLCLKDWLPAIAANRKTFQVKKGETVFKEGGKVNGIFFITKGKFKVHKKWGDEKELIVRIAGDGTILGHRGLGSDSIYPVTATALEPSYVCFIGLDFFASSIQVNQLFSYQLLMFFADELRESERRMRNLAHMPVKGRVAQALISLAEKYGTTEQGRLNLQLSKQDISAYAGATYETVFRVLNEIAEAGGINMNKKEIRILDDAVLHSFLSPA